MALSQSRLKYWTETVAPYTRAMTRALSEILRKLVRLTRWIFEFAIPVYLLTAVICFTLLNIALRDYSVTVPGIGTFSSQNLALTTAPAVPPYAPGKAPVATGVEGLQERVELLKDGQEKTLTVIAALAAVLTFLGFKGYNTISDAREKVREAEQRAEAVKRQFDEFMSKDYKLDITGSMNVMHGIVAREVSDSLEKTIRATNPTADPCADPQYVTLVDSGIYYVKQVTSGSPHVSRSVLKRAHGVMGNLQKRKKNYEIALEHAGCILELMDGKDENAWYNKACYSSLIAGKYHSMVPPNTVEEQKYTRSCFDALAECFKLDPSQFKHAAKTELDLVHVRTNHATDFDKAIA